MKKGTLAKKIMVYLWEVDNTLPMLEAICEHDKRGLSNEVTALIIARYNQLVNDGLIQPIV